MYLSDIDKRIIYEEGGLANQFSMQILIRLGEWCPLKALMLDVYILSSVPQ